MPEPCGPAGLSCRQKVRRGCPALTRNQANQHQSHIVNLGELNVPYSQVKSSQVKSVSYVWVPPRSPHSVSKDGSAALSVNRSGKRATSRPEDRGAALTSELRAPPVLRDILHVTCLANDSALRGPKHIEYSARHTYENIYSPSYMSHTHACVENLSTLCATH